MQQALLSSPNVSPTKTVPLIQSHLLTLHTHYSDYKYMTQKFHKFMFYTFCLTQVIWVTLSFNIVTLNYYNVFIDEFAANMNLEFKKSYLQEHPNYENILNHINTFDSDYTIICCLIWISHFGIQILLGYVFYINRTFFKEYQTVFKEMLPIFFALLTSFVIRDSLLMSTTSLVLNDLKDIQYFIETQNQEFMALQTNFKTFIYTNLLLIQNYMSDFQILQILTYFQEICDLYIVSAMTLQLFKIYFKSLNCIKTLQQMKDKKQWAIAPLIKPQPPASHRHMSQFSKLSEQKQLSVSHPTGIFTRKNLIQSHKQIGGGYSHKSPNEHYFQDVLHHQDISAHQAIRKQSPLAPDKVTVLKKSKSNKHFRKIPRSGSFNYLKGNYALQAFGDTIYQKSKPQEHNMNDKKLKHPLETKLKLKKIFSQHQNDSKYSEKNNQMNHQGIPQKLVHGQKVVFQV